MIRRILVALDLSEPSSAPLEAAVELARSTGASVLVLYVVLPPYQKKQWYLPYLKDEEDLVHRLERQERQAAQKQLDARIAALSGREDLRIESLVGSGIPSDVIDQTAAELHVDLIITGTHGRKGLRRALLGSVAERVIRTAPCPVITVHPAGGGTWA